MNESVESDRAIFDVCGDLAVMEVDPALHITTPVQFREVNTAFDVEDTLGFA